MKKKDFVRETLEHSGSIVLGLNDAIVETTGALAGLSFALQNTQLVALAGTITGIAASLSMASSEYLSRKTERAKHPKISSVYTGIAYFIAVILLVSPFYLTSDYMVALGGTVAAAIVIIAIFSYFVTKSQKISFSKRFTETLFISLGVALISFIIGYILRMFLNIDV